MPTAQEQTNALKLAQMIATAVFTKLGLSSQYTVAVRRHGDPVAMPWIEIAWCRIGKPPETHEHCISLPEVHYILETKEERTELANYFYKTTARMLGKTEPK